MRKQGYFPAGLADAQGDLRVEMESLVRLRRHDAALSRQFRYSRLAPYVCRGGSEMIIRQSRRMLQSGEISGIHPGQL